MALLDLRVEVVANLLKAGRHVVERGSQLGHLVAVLQVDAVNEIVLLGDAAGAGQQRFQRLKQPVVKQENGHGQKHGRPGQSGPFQDDPGAVFAAGVIDERPHAVVHHRLQAGRLGVHFIDGLADDVGLAGQQDPVGVGFGLHEPGQGGFQLADGALFLAAVAEADVRELVLLQVPAIMGQVLLDAGHFFVEAVSNQDAVHRAGLRQQVEKFATLAEADAQVAQALGQLAGQFEVGGPHFDGPRQAFVGVAAREA